MGIKRDLIDRQALIGVFAGLVPYAIDGPEDDAYARGLDAGYQALVEAPAVDAEPVKRGKWITCDDGWGGVHYQCSACGQEWFLVDGTPEENGMNYCPHCGAKMEV